MAGLRGQPGGDRMDVIVLACTHFPLLQDELQAAAGPDVRLIDGAAGIARRIAYLTEGQPRPDTPAPGIAVFTRSDDRPPPPPPPLAPSERQRGGSGQSVSVRVELGGRH